MSQVVETQRECHQNSESSNETVQLDKSQESAQKFEWRRYSKTDTIYDLWKIYFN